MKKERTVYGYLMILGIILAASEGGSMMAFLVVKALAFICMFISYRKLQAE